MNPVPKGTVLFRAGDASSSFFIIEAGLVRVTRPFEPNAAFVSVFGSGSVFGERGLVAQGPRTATAETLCDSTLTEIACADFADAATKLPDLWAWLARQLLQRNADMERRIFSMTHLRVERRILLLLADFADSMEAVPEPHRLPLTQNDVAMLVGATRETTSTTLNQLQRRGLLRLGRGVIEVASAVALRTAAQSSR
jgi:CRP/FNR family cyclic AMP-dependent transcriptional regulator